MRTRDSRLRSRSSRPVAQARPQRETIRSSWLAVISTPCSLRGSSGTTWPGALSVSGGGAEEGEGLEWQLKYWPGALSVSGGGAEEGEGLVM